VQIVNIVNIVIVVQRTLKNIHGKWVRLFQCYKLYQRLREHPRAVNTEQCFFFSLFLLKGLLSPVPIDLLDQSPFSKPRSSVMDISVFHLNTCEEKLEKILSESQCKSHGTSTVMHVTVPPHFQSLSSLGQCHIPYECQA